MSQPFELVQARVASELRRGATIDVYKLAEILQEHCPGMTVEDIAKLISDAVVTHHGCSVLWERKPQT